MTRTNLYSALLLSAVAVAGCDFQKKSVSTPLEPTAAVPSMLGTWSSTASANSASASPQGCTNFTWAITSQSATDIAGNFTAVCLGTTNITGTGTGHVSG